MAAAGAARTVVDLGAGPGYYLAALLDAKPARTRVWRVADLVRRSRRPK